MQVKAQFAIGLTVWCALAMSARGQSFNIDIGTATIGNPGFGVPSATFVGAADQPGTWNAVTATGVGPYALVGLDGTATAVTLTRTTGTGGTYGFNNANTSGNFALLMDDAQDIGPVNSVVTYTIGSLSAGSYMIFVYAGAPDNAATVTNVSFPLPQPPLSILPVSGALPVNAFVEGVTHEVLATTLSAAGSISIRVESSAGNGRCNGIQIVRRTYVKANAIGANNGRSWTDAYTSLQSALVAGNTGQVWVAAGTYKPTTTIDRTVSFQLQNNLSVFGGFAGTESRLTQRNPAANPAILSGDIGVVNDATDNSYHVVEAAGTVNSTARLDGFTIQGGTANGSSPDNRGGGLLLAGSPVIRNCIIANSTSINGGGGVQGNGSAVLVDCVIRSNTTTTAGFNGGGVYVGSGTLTLVNSVVAQNSAAAAGGGIAIQNASATVNCHNCIFNANSSGTHGGAAVSLIGSLNAINCTFVNNNAPSAGGAVVRNNSGVVANLTNCVTRSNTGSSQFITNGPTNITYSNIQGGFTGAGNIDADPLFADADGPDNVAGNLDDDLRILSASPCVNTGNTALLPDDIADLDGDGVTTEDLSLDFRGRQRTTDSSVDMGAYELSRIFVRTAATGANDGSSWTNAYTSLATALTAVSSDPTEEIWVAAGSYRPSAVPNPNPSTSFVLGSGMALLGGFEGTETVATQRNAEINVTTLSGDNLADDVEDSSSNISDNARHVVRIPVSATNVLVDGFHIRRGFAYTFEPPGAGVTTAGDLELRRCIIADNESGAGGGVYNTGQLVITGCTLRDNIGGWEGGGLEADGGSTIVDKSIFSHNIVVSPSHGWGGGISSTDNALNLTIRDSIFINNIGHERGGAVFSRAQTLSISGCTFVANACEIGGLGGGALWSATTGPTISNSIFWSNMNESGPYRQLRVEPSTTVRNCLIQGGVDLATSMGIPPENWTGILDKDPLLTPDGRLRTGSPCIDAGTTTGASETDIDSEPRLSGAGVDLGADEFIDSDSDGLPNAWELRYFPPSGVTAGSDSDGDGFSALTEYTELASVPNLPPIYVSNNGNDALPGFTTADPKRTLQGALDAVADGSTIRIINSPNPNFNDPLNRNLDTHRKNVVIRGTTGSPSIVIDCADGQFLDPYSLGGGRVVVYGVTIMNATSASGYGGAFEFRSGMQLQVRNCSVSGNSATYQGGGVYSMFSHPVFSAGTLGSNSSPAGDGGRIESSMLQILNDWRLTSGILEIRNSTMHGPGDLRLDTGATLAIKGYGQFGGNGPTITYTDIRGTGNIVIDGGQELRLVGGATIDLSSATGASSCNCSSILASGTVTVNGKLIANGGRVQNTNVVVNQGDLGDGMFILHNNISLPETVPATASTAGFGGEFFVENDSTICCNHIISYGDRYLDIDPRAEAQNQTISNNTIDVIITQSTADGQGELLELRAYDYSPNDPCPGWPAPCAIQRPLGDAGFSDKWAINRLEVQSNARVTLTNRKNFEFNLNPQPPLPPTRDAIYIKTLVLYPNAVFNVGLQRMYFGSIVNESGVVLTPNPSGDYGGGRRIIDVPLLGFSLKVINFEDPTMPPSNEMDVRLRTRVQDDPTLDPSLPTTPLGEVVRTTATASTPSGTQLWNVMAMDTQATGHPAVTHVAAKGAFARCGEDEIEVAFLYDFDATSSADAVLSVYLSDSPDQGQSLGPLLATVRPPSTGVAGSISSTKFATFRGKFARGNLDMRRGTFIELKLTGTNARVLIDDFDPLVCGSFICGDLGGEQWYDGVVTGADFLYLLSQQGRPRDGSNYCTDSMIADSYVDMGDILMWEAQSHTPGMNLCASGSGSPSGSASQAAANVPDAELIIAGKEQQMVTPSGQLERFPTRLFDFNPGTAKVGLGGLPHGASQSIDSVGYGRLLRRSTGELFQLHSGYGILPFASGPAFVPPGQKSFTGGASMVHVGFTAAGDKPILDAVFDRTDPAVVYVVPVRVAPNSNPLQKYKAAAKLRHNPLSADYSVERLYGLNPYLDNSNNTTPPEFAAANVQNPREIEVDNFGNVFVISAIGDANNGNNWLLIYRFDTGAETRVPLSSSITDPSAMLVTTNKIYLAAGLNGAVDNQTFVYRFSINYSGTAAIGATLDSNGTYTIHDMRQVTAMTLGANGALRVVGYVAPTFDPNHAFGPVEDMFATPVMATLFASPQTVTAVAITGGNLSPPLSLPLSVVLANTGCPGPKGDFNGDQLVNAADIPGFINVMMNGTGGSSQTLCRADFTGDGIANGRDIDGFVQMIIP